MTKSNNLTLIDLGFFDIPTWAIYYFSYGETEHMEPEEVEQCDTFLKELQDEGYKDIIFEFANDREFNHSPAFGLPSMTVSTSIYARRTNAQSTTID